MRLQSWVNANLLKCSSWWLFLRLQVRVHEIHYVYRTAREVRLCVLHFDFGGVMGYGHCSCPLPPLQPRGRINRCVPPPRGSSSPAHLGHPLRPPLAVRPFSLTRRFLIPRCTACGSALHVDPLSLLLVLRLLSCAHLCACSSCSGRSDVFSRIA